MKRLILEDRYFPTIFRMREFERESIKELILDLRRENISEICISHFKITFTKFYANSILAMLQDTDGSLFTHVIYLIEDIENV